MALFRISRDEWGTRTFDIIGDLTEDPVPVVRTTGADAASANVILAWPAGLVYFNDDGGKSNRTVKVRVEQRLAGADEWQPVQELEVTAQRTEAFYRQHEWTFPTRGRWRWQVRCTMLTDESNDSKAQQRTVWGSASDLSPGISD